MLPKKLQDDHEGERTLDDDNFIDDTGVDPSDRYGSDREHSPSRAPEVGIVSSFDYELFVYY